MKKRMFTSLISLICTLGFVNMVVGCSADANQNAHLGAPGATAMQNAKNRYQEFLMVTMDLCKKDIGSINKYTGGDSERNPAKPTFSSEGQTFNGYYDIIYDYTVFIVDGSVVGATKEADAPLYGLITLSKDYIFDDKKLSKGEKFIQIPKVDNINDNTCPL